VEKALMDAGLDAIRAAEGEVRDPPSRVRHDRLRYSTRER